MRNIHRRHRVYNCRDYKSLVYLPIKHILRTYIFVYIYIYRDIYIHMCVHWMMPPMDVMKPNPGRVCSLQWNAARWGDPRTHTRSWILRASAPTRRTQDGRAATVTRSIKKPPLLLLLVRRSFDQNFEFFSSFVLE